MRIKVKQKATEMLYPKAEGKKKREMTKEESISNTCIDRKEKNKRDIASVQMAMFTVKGHLNSLHQ